MKIQLDKSRTIQLGTEFHFIYHRFYKEIENIEDPLKQIIPPNIKSSLHRQNILIGLPYWLLEFVDKIPPLNNIRALSLGNLFGSLYCLTQDKLMDGECDQDIQPILNIYYYKWVKEYHRVFDCYSAFWILFEKYLLEYSNSIFWERQEHWGKVKPYEEKDLLFIGNKLAPLKMCCAAICLMDGKEHFIPHFSKLICYYHIGFQLADDLKDWKEDLASGNFSYLLTIIHNEFGEDSMTVDTIQDILRTTDVVDRIIEKSSHYYELARKMSRELGCDQLERFVGYEMEKNTDLLQNYRRTAMTQRPVQQVTPNPSLSLYKKQIHIFDIKDKTYLYTVDAMNFFEIDKMTKDVLLSLKNRFTLSEVLLLLKDRYNENEVKSLVSELLQMNVLSPKQNIQEELSFEPQGYNCGLTSLAVELIREQNGRPVLITKDILYQAVNFLFKMGWTSSLSLTFLTSNLINSDLENMLRFGIDYATKLARKLHKEITFSIHIDDMIILDQRSMACIFSLQGVKKILVIVNPERIHAKEVNYEKFFMGLDKMSKRGKPLALCVYQRTTENLLYNCDKLRKFINRLSELNIHSLRFSTETHGGLILPFLMGNLLTNSESLISNFIRLSRRLQLRNPQKYFCEAGRKYLVVDPSGKVYPCHKFMESQLCEMGNVMDGIWRKQAPYINAHVEKKQACRVCWARNVCGGGCFYQFYLKSGSINKIDVNWCNILRSNIEQAIDLYSELEKKGKFYQMINGSDHWPCDMF